MRVKLDENVAVDAVELFARFGHDADTVIDEGLTGASDDILRRPAADAGRMVVTLDVGFADIRLEPVGGVVLLRLADQQPANVLAVIERLVTHHDLDDFAGCIVVVTERLIRIRRPEVGREDRRQGRSRIGRASIEWQRVSGPPTSSCSLDHV